MAGKRKVIQKKSRKSKARASESPHLSVPADISSGASTEHGLQLAILDRGFIYVGDVTTDSHWCVISNAKNVRQWGTKEGLGELALKGPLPDTQLDETGTVRAPLKSLIALIACNRREWKS